MAYSVDWIGKTVTIPASDLVLVSGSRYQLQMSAFLGEIRRLEAAFDEGLWAPQILDHTNPKLDFAGTDYAGFDEIINGYSILFEYPAITRVDLLGSNNNIIDVLTVTGTSVVPSNSQGLQLVSVGSGLSAAEQLQLQEIHNAHHKPREWDRVGKKIYIYSDNTKTTILHEFDVNDDLSDIQTVP